MTVPKLRFKEFGGDWSKKRLDSFLERTSNPVNVIDTQNYVQIGIRSHGKGIFHKESVTGKEIGNKRVFWVVPNALVVNIVFAWERAIAVTSDKENGLIASHRFPMYLPKDGLSDVNFLRYMFITDKGQSYLELASPGGAGRNKTLGQSNFAELKIDLPIVEEQTKIASFLSNVDEKISQLTQKHELLSQYKQGMMQKLFSQQIRFIADDGSEFREWEEKALLELSEKAMYGMNASATEYDGKNKYLRITDICEKSHKFKTDSLTSPNAELEEKYKLNLGDLLFARTGASVGKSYLYSPNDGITYFAGFLIRFSLKQDKVNPYFIFLQTLTKDFDKWVATNSMRSGQPGINAEEYSSYIFKVPCLEEQIKIANFLSAIDQKIEVVAQQIEQAKTWKKGLLQQMFV